MESVCIAATCFSLGASIAKASMALAHFVRDTRDASEDIETVSKELHALSMKKDMMAIRDQTDAIKVNTDIILARLDQIRSQDVPRTFPARTKEPKSGWTT
ncbi:hypothetical protein B0T14DRAFT_565288 [Immersiella caudata]|uniref:Fungal N-terminal domain-containing protein n=1 Tax=Immersiella caudata TaxID=314043 RepID=A0AA39WYK4_9PEZI|nr:hypothetical protein B0T14DRAFT_565288 [Immersiella caudata]